MWSLESMIRRSIELQAAQVLQNGKISAPISYEDENDKDVVGKEIDFKGNADHYPGATIIWKDAKGSEMMKDINYLANTIRKNGLTAPDQIIMGMKAYDKFFANT